MKNIAALLAVFGLIASSAISQDSADIPVAPDDSVTNSSVEAPSASGDSITNDPIEDPSSSDENMSGNSVESIEDEDSEALESQAVEAPPTPDIEFGD
jgi:hypothetical protein